MSSAPDDTSPYIDTSGAVPRPRVRTLLGALGGGFILAWVYGIIESIRQVGVQIGGFVDWALGGLSDFGGQLIGGGETAVTASTSVGAGAVSASGALGFLVAVGATFAALAIVSILIGRVVSR